MHIDYNFDRVISRKDTASYKWDQLTAMFGSEDVLPLWVADMDFPCPEPVIAAAVKRAQEGVYGYTIRTDAWSEAMIGWYKRRHQWMIEKESVLTSPSVVTSLALAVELFTEPGSGVVLQSPVYHPFYDVIGMNGRNVCKNPLVAIEGQYRMDLAQLELQFREHDAKMILLCNPHNPGGRVWSFQELRQLAQLCSRYDVVVVSDEIHCDLVFDPHQYTPFAKAAEGVPCTFMTLLAATKTFNIPGIQSSFIVAEDARIRNKLNHRMRSLSIHMHNFFAHTATIAAYEEGAEWLDQVVPYIKANIDYAISYLYNHAPILVPMTPEGTYLLWIDARKLQLSASGMKQWMYEQAKVAFNEGSMFGAEGEGFIRINCACPRSILQTALERLVRAI